MVTHSDVIILALTECVCDVVVITKYSMPISHIYTYPYIIHLYCVSMPTLYLRTLTHKVLRTRDQFPQTLLLFTCGSVLYSAAAARIEEIHTCHPRRFNSHSVTVRVDVTLMLLLGTIILYVTTL